MEILANRLDRCFELHQDEYEEAALRVLRSGWYILGTEVDSFEKEFAAFVGCKYAVGLASGLDALCLAFRVLGVGVGDEVLVPSNTYIASVMGITINGATPIFVEPDVFFNIDVAKIEEKISNRTKAILVVHLYGQACRMDKIVDICEKYDLRLVEDCAQAHGATFQGRKVGSFGDVGCFSFYPSKNLGAFGDAGAVVVHTKELRDLFKIYRNYGSNKRYYNKVVGVNSRLDEMQAALLRVKLKYIDEIIEERKDIARTYLLGVKNKRIILPTICNEASHVWHQFVVRCTSRNELSNHLKEHGIGSIIHYPIPPHLAEAYYYLGYKKGDYPLAEKYADEVLSIPMYNGMTEEEQQKVIDVMNAF